MPIYCLHIGLLDFQYSLFLQLIDVFIYAVAEMRNKG